MKRFLFFILFFSTISAKVPNVRIKLNLKRPQIVFQSKQAFQLENNGSKKTIPANSRVKIQCKKFINDNSKILFAEVDSNGGIVQVNQESYRGKIKIYKDHKKKKCFLVGEMNIEDYIQSILPREMSASWPVEALKAQAVASRTYAIHRILKMDANNPIYHLENSEKDQVNGSVKDWTKKTSQAIRETAGQVLVNEENKLVPAFFHAKCGGSTLRPGQVWDGQYASYERVKDPYCISNGMSGQWKVKITRDDFRRFFRSELMKKGIELKLSFREEQVATDSIDRAYLRVYVGSIPYLINKAALRKYFGRFKVRSNHFTLERLEGQSYQMVGRGHGHGVGMCQIGAWEISKLGEGYRRILKHYYPKLRIVSYMKKG